MTNHSLHHRVHLSFHQKKPSLSDATDNMQNQSGSLYHASWTFNLVRVGVEVDLGDGHLSHLLY